MSSYDEVVSESMHELRYFNQRLKNLSEQLSKELKVDEIGKGTPLNTNSTHADQIRTMSEGILSLSQLFTTRLHFIDIELNPEIIRELPVVPVSILGKFDKARRMLNSQARGKKVKIKINKTAEIVNFFDAFPIIDILPYLILDNAVKYSPNKNEVSIEFEVCNGLLEISIESIGPFVDSEEIESLTKKGYRGKGTESLSVTGSGLGLHFVQYICNLHNIILTISSKEPFCEFHGIPHSLFLIKLEIPVA
jgi:signal transduction histidine kinase